MPKNKVRKKKGKNGKMVKVKYIPPKKKGMSRKDMDKFIDMIKKIQSMPKGSHDEITEKSIDPNREEKNEYNGNESQEK